MDKPKRPAPWNGDLSVGSTPRIADIMKYVFAFPCCCVTIIKDIEWVEISTSQRVERLRPGAELVEVEVKGFDVSIYWSIGGYSVSVHRENNNPVHFSWDGLRVMIRHNAPAGHPLVWIYAPESHGEEE